MRVAVLTVSDAGARGERADGSGDAIASWASTQGCELAARALVPDDGVAIARQLAQWCDEDCADLVLTTGGTGLSARDVTPEATRAVLERDAPGIAERLRGVTGENVPRAALARGVAGVRARTLVVNLPGSRAAVVECLAALEPIVHHAVDILRGSVTEHDRTSRSAR
jgi:molybdenum cofactor synthesis domain-containing protein